MKHNFTKKIDLIIHGYDDDWCDNDEHDDTENVNEMEDINADDEIESSNPEYCEQNTTIAIFLKIMPGYRRLWHYSTSFCSLCKNL